MAESTGYAGPFLTSREAADLLSYSRPDSLLRAWRAAGLPVYKRASGRNIIAESDLARFVSLDEEALR